MLLWWHRNAFHSAVIISSTQMLAPAPMNSYDSLVILIAIAPPFSEQDYIGMDAADTVVVQHRTRKGTDLMNVY